MKNVSYHPFWVLSVVKNDIQRIELLDWTVCSTIEVKKGNSPLKEFGEKFITAMLPKSSLSCSDLWLFPKQDYTADLLAKYSHIFQAVLKSVTGALVSSDGRVISYANGGREPLTIPTIEPVTSHGVMPVTESMLENAIKISDNIVMLPRDQESQYTAVFRYLVDIRSSPVFIGELALWSFLEHRWARDKKNTGHDESLSVLLKLVYPGKDEKHNISLFNKKISAIGKSLGKDYDEKHLRNMLAHGKHSTLKDEWTNEQWRKFSEVHEQLFSIVIMGLMKELEEI